MNSVILIALLTLATPSWAFSDVFNTYPFGFHPSPQMVGGIEAKPQSYPYQVGVKVYHSAVTEEFCSGALLSKEWVITAAHCVQGAPRVVAVIGAHKIQERETTVQQVPVVETILHPSFDPENITNDIALLKLSDQLVLVKGIIAPVKLPQLSKKDVSFWSREAIVTGWGRTGTTSSAPGSVLQQTETQVVTNKYCQIIYLDNLITESHLCTAGYPGNALGNGDSGAPLVVDENGAKILIGIASYQKSSGMQPFPAVFMRVSAFLEWIYAKTGLTPV